MTRRPHFCKIGCWLALALCGPASAVSNMAEIADMSIEDLANIQITSVSKKPEALAGAAASVFVITAADLRRAGVTNLPDALRLAPAIQVAQTSNLSYAISARGLNGTTGAGPNKLQVLIDGRSVYSPLFSGVFWDAQDVLIEDIERIEVISGPGGTLWGVNAVNGVINVITKNAADTRGSLVALRGGNRGGDLSVREGGQSGRTHWRVHAKHQDQRHNELASGAPINDARHHSQAGFRADWHGEIDTVSVHGDLYRGRSGQPEPGLLAVAGLNPVLEDVRVAGINLTGSWQRRLAAGGTLNAQASFERTRRVARPMFVESLNIADLQLMHQMAAMGAHQVSLGASYRRTWDDVARGEIAAFLPGRLHQQWSSVFAQDELALGEALKLTGGLRMERNPYTGTEWLPNLRLAWMPAPSHMVWAAASRTVRAPARIDVDIFVPGRPPHFLRGGPTVRSEVARVIELGYRGQPWEGVSYSVTGFYNDYDHLRTQELHASRTYVTFGSLMEGKARGIEMWGSYQPAERWRLSAGYTALHEDMWLKAGSNNAPAPAGATGKNPSHMAQLRSTFDVSAGQQFELAVRKVAALDSPAVPGYTAVDARYVWEVRPGLELALIGQNLNGSHAEYGPAQYRTEVPRSVAVRLVWQP